jgi:hypothetical protein
VTRMQLGLVITVTAIVCALILGVAWGIAHDGTTPARPASTPHTSKTPARTTTPTTRRT